MRPLESEVGPALRAPVGAPWSRARWRTTVGLKVTMGATGVILVTFLVFHLLGNLLVYQGPAALNAYSALLFRDPSLLWAARAILLGSALLHTARRPCSGQMTVRDGRCLTAASPHAPPRSPPGPCGSPASGSRSSSWSTFST
jgi:hypothetical protein